MGIGLPKATKRRHVAPVTSVLPRGYVAIHLVSDPGQSTPLSKISKRISPAAPLTLPPGPAQAALPPSCSRGTALRSPIRPALGSFIFMFKKDKIMSAFPSFLKNLYFLVVGVFSPQFSGDAICQVSMWVCTCDTIPPTNIMSTCVPLWSRTPPHTQPLLFLLVTISHCAFARWPDVSQLHWVPHAGRKHVCFLLHCTPSPWRSAWYK